MNHESNYNSKKQNLYPTRHLDFLHEEAVQDAKKEAKQWAQQSQAKSQTNNPYPGYVKKPLPYTQLA